tara:strand:+ start:1537 stop:1806 length:270 start_codon:yes stop_codon:yes gene_type:complete
VIAAVAVISPVTVKVLVDESNLRFDSQYSEFASPSIFVMIPLLVAFVTRGTNLTDEASDVLKLPETILFVRIPPGWYVWAAITVPDNIL